MPNKPGNDDRLTGGNGDRERQREIANEGSRQAGSSTSGSARTRSNRGFASMDRDKQKEIASKGGKAAHAKGTAHEFDSSEAREAGRKGGMAVSRNRDHMAAIGRRGGEARGQSRGRGAPVQTNTGGAPSTDAGLQNSRAGANNVPLADRSESANERAASPSVQGSRGGNSSLGGEHRGASTGEVERESFGNR